MGMTVPARRHTLIGTRSAMSSGGTRVPHNLVMRRKDAYVCMGMIPGMMGTVIPAPIRQCTFFEGRFSDLPFCRTFPTHARKLSTS